MRMSSGKPECWNPVTGEIISHLPYKQNGHRTEVTLTLAPNESVFIVYTTNHLQKEPVVFDKALVTKDFQPKEYTVSFASNGKVLIRKELFDWSKESDDAIRYYSGTATYKTTFYWKERLLKNQRLFLYLGTVHNLATVRVNGVDCGTIWTAPYRADITASLRRGSNQLEIEVTNTWANALQGADEKKAPFPEIWTNAKYRKQEEGLLPAGLIGPLELKIGE